MRWPWVAREHYDLALQHFNEERERRWRADLRVDDANRRFDELLQRVMPLAAPGQQPKPALALAVPQRDDLQDAIDLAAGNDKGLARHLARWTRQQQMDKVDEHTIIQAVFHWRHDEWDGDEDDVPSVF